MQKLVTHVVREAYNPWGPLEIYFWLCPWGIVLLSLKWRNFPKPTFLRKQTASLSSFYFMCRLQNQGEEFLGYKELLLGAEKGRLNSTQRKRLQMDTGHALSDGSDAIIALHD